MNNNQFKQDIIDLFKKKKGGHVQKWLYSDHLRPDRNSGSKLWHSFVDTNKKYYPIQGEISLINSLINSINYNYDTIIDFGLGDASAVNNKIIPILKSQKNLKRYIAIDISNEQLNHGINLIQHCFNNIETTAIQGDFYKKQTVGGEKRLGLFLGTSISNQEMMVGETLPKEAIINRLKTLGETVKGDNDGDLIISFDTNPNLEHALDAYQHPTWILMMTGLMYDVQDILKPSGDFNPTMWHYSPVIDKKNHVLHQIISPTIDQKFSIDKHEFFLKKGEQFVVKNNFKYPLDLFAGLLKESDLKLKKTPIKSTDHSMVMLEVTSSN